MAKERLDVLMKRMLDKNRFWEYDYHLAEKEYGIDNIMLKAQGALSIIVLLKVLLERDFFIQL